ncbi:MAG: hypothetical protein AAF717_04620 [Bacteroidota bacterium]
MEKKLLFLFILLIGGFAFSQTIFDTEKRDSTNIYYHSLKKMSELAGSSIADNGIIYVEKNLFTDRLPDTVLDLKIEYLNQAELIEKMKKKGEKIFLIRIVPLRIEKGTFFINVIPFNAYYYKKNLELVNSGGLKAEYKFDEEVNGLVFEKANFGGI